MARREERDYLDVGFEDDEQAELESISEQSDAAEDSRTAWLAQGASRKRNFSDSFSEDASDLNSNVYTTLPVFDSPPLAAVDKLSIAILEKRPLRNQKHLGPRITTKPKSKPGIVYISRIPPYLKPQTLRQMISVHGPVTNLFLTPEPSTAYHNRVHTHHGNKKRQYIDGWVEFQHKRHAKSCIDALNGRTTAEGLGVGAIGARKGGKGRWYKDDVWSVKYLRGFSWDDLMQSARTEEREREERVRFGVMKEKKERQAFLAGVQGAKVEETRRKKQRRKEADTNVSGPSSIGDEKAGENEEAHGFRQNEVWKAGGKATHRQDGVQRVLSRIF